MEPQTLALLAVTSVGMTVGFVLLGAQQARHSQVLAAMQMQIANLDEFCSAAQWLLATPRCYFCCKTGGEGERELMHVEADDAKGMSAFYFCGECGRENHSDFESARQQIDGLLEFRNEAQWLLIPRCFICCKADGNGVRRLRLADPSVEGAPSVPICSDCNRELDPDIESVRDTLDGVESFLYRASWILAPRCYLCCRTGVALFEHPPEGNLPEMLVCTDCRPEESRI